MNEHEKKLKELTDLFETTFLIEDKGLIPTLLAVPIAHRMRGSPIWLFLKAPSGSGKTEMISSLLRTKGTHLISSITKNTFISGKQLKVTDANPHASLLLRLTNADGSSGGLLIFKDLRC